MPVIEGMAALKSLKTLYDIAKDVRDATDPEKLRAAAAQMLDLSLAAREQTAELQDERTAALETVKRLEAQIAEMKSWATEQQRYELKIIASGALVYMLKPEARGTEPAHWLCQNCYENGKKRMLQPQGSSPMPGRGHSFKCPDCGSSFRTEAFCPTWIG